MKLGNFLACLLLVASCDKSDEQPTSTPSGTAAAPSDGAAPAEAPAAEPLPLDPAVRIGTLDNGLTYYIRQHPEPAKRARLWMAVNAGSVLEDDDQRGLAHFVEHMAFNGTERFEKNNLIDFIERAGMDFGADLNAYTSFDETVYMLTVPTDDAELLKTGWDILEDWSGALSFDPEEVDKERGVVIEEWRLGRGASQRVFDKQFPIFLEGSKYADRKPIGDKKILETAPPKTLRRFYEDWYRPDNMAIVAVGDLDPDKVEKEIKARFGDLKNPDKPRERVMIDVPLLDKTRAAVDTDPESTLSTVTLAIKGPFTPLVTEEDYRSHLVERVFHGMLRGRLDEIRREPESPFVFAFTFTGDMGHAVDIFRLFAGAKPGMVDKALQTLTTEVERVRRHGFLDSEFTRVKAEMMANMERSYKEESKADSRGFAFEAVRHFLDQEAMPGRKVELDLTKRHLPEITLEEVNALAGKWTSRKDRTVMASGASRDKMPSQKQLLAIVDAVGKADITPYEDAGTTGTLMATAPKPGTITKREKIEEIGAQVWTLSNGARVLVKPTDFKNDQVLFQAFSPGGDSLASKADYWSASAATGVVAQAGVGEHDGTAVDKLLAGKTVRVSPWIGELEEGFNGFAAPGDLETLMQLVHLRFTAPRRDPKAFEAWKSSMNAFVKNRDLSPQQVFRDEMRKVAAKDHPRRRPMTTETLDKVDLDKAFEFYTDRFADAGDFTFLFVGNVDTAKLETLATTYLASLPTTGRKERWKDVKVKLPKGKKEVRVSKGQDPKSTVSLVFHGDAKWTQESEDDLDALAEVLEIRLREVLREEMSGVYGAYSFGRWSRRPKGRYAYRIGFGCAPENAEKLKKAVFDEIAKIKADGVPEEYLAKVREQRRRKLETDMESNRFWIRRIEYHLRYGSDPAKLVDLEKKSMERIESKNIQNAAKRFLGKSFIDGVLMPAGS